MHEHDFLEFGCRKGWRIISPLKKDGFLRALLDHACGGIPPALVVVSVPLVFYNPTTNLVYGFAARHKES
jgi:hypothetical protein